MRKHWKKIAGIAAALIIVLLLLAPTIALRSGMVAKWVNQYSGLNGTIEFGSASLGWFSPVEFKDVTVKDETGKTAAQISRLSVSRNLFGLVFSGITGAQVQIDDAELHVRRDDKKINWLELIPEDDSDAPSDPLKLGVTLNNANFLFTEDDDSSGQLSNVQGSIQLRPSSIQPDGQTIAIELNSSGTLDLQGTLEFASSGEIKEVTSTLSSSHADFSFLNPLLDHYGIPQVSMAVEGQSRIRWAPTDDSYTLDCQFEEMSLESTREEPKQLLRDYPIVPMKLSGTLHINSATPSGLQVTTNFGQVFFDGLFPSLDRLDVSALTSAPFRLNGNIDLAKFAKNHPELLKIREGVRLDEGLITLSAFNRTEGEKQRTMIDIRTDQLTGMHGTQKIEWRKPVRLSCALTRPPNEQFKSIELEFLECESDFLKISGSGGIRETDSAGNVRLTGDLALLKNRLEQFFDLGNFQLAGLLDGNLSWKSQSDRQSTSSFQLNGNTTFQKFAFGFSPDEGWNEQMLTLFVAADWKFEQGQLKELAKLDTRITVDQDLAKFVLRTPVQFSEDYQCIFDAELTGSSQKWTRRLNSLFDTGVQLEGEAGITAVVSATPKFIRTRSKQFSLKPFRLQVAGLDIDDPLARAQVDLVYSRLNGAIKANKISVTTPNLLVESQTFESSVVKSDRVTSGDFQVTGKAQRISGWLFPENLVARGPIQGSLKLRFDEKGMHWNSKLVSDNFELLQRVEGNQPNRSRLEALIPAGPAMLAGDGSYVDGVVKLGNNRLAATQAEFEVSGSLDLSGETTVLDLSGKLQTDLQQLLDYLAPYLSPEIQLAGGKESSFRIVGPLTDSQSTGLIPNKLAGNAELKWDKGEIFSLPVDRGSLSVVLADSEILIRPKNMKIASGELTVEPKLVLRKEPYTLLIPAGTMIRNADIGPKVFRTWMRYLTPLLADATEARGSFSMQLDKASVLPLNNPLTGNLYGKMMINSATVGPGPLGQRMIATLQQVLAIIGKDDKLRSFREKPWLALPKQEIKIAIEGGNVTHQLLQFQVGEVRVYTSGTVDLNQNVNMVVMVPIEADWFKERPIVKSIIGEAIQIPLKGNLANPKFDLEFLKSLSKRLAVGAVEKLIDDKTGGLLKNKFLPGDGNSGSLRNLFEDKAKGLLKDSILKGLDKLNKKD